MTVPAIVADDLIIAILCVLDAQCVDSTAERGVGLANLESACTEERGARERTSEKFQS